MKLWGWWVVLAWAPLGSAFAASEIRMVGCPTRILELRRHQSIRLWLKESRREKKIWKSHEGLVSMPRHRGETEYAEYVIGSQQVMREIGWLGYATFHFLQYRVPGSFELSDVCKLRIKLLPR